MSTEAITRYTTDSGVEVALSPKTVRDYLVSGTGAVSDQEVVMFLQLCRSQRLNPFLREAYLIKYGNQPASIVTGKDTFIRRAEQHPQFDGFEAGVTLVDKEGELTRREGSLFGAKTEQLVGGWARVHRKDRAHPSYVEVAHAEYEGRKNDGTVNRQWERMPGTIIRKFALVQALREAFPDAFGGLYSPEEMSNVDGAALPSEPVQQPEPEVVDAEVMADDALLAEIRAARASLGVDDDTYVKQLQAAAQDRTVTSDTEMTEPQARKLLSAYQVQITKRELGAEEA